ncbi:MAG: adenylate kinase [Clostridia bacterium]|nr:adenylate kinase [Clostridia bacterium]
MRLVLLGPPGAGKGTQASKLAEKYAIPHISTGEIFRRAYEEGTELGRKAREYMEKGALVPDEITVGIVRDRLDLPDAQRGFLLDGFPRNVAQAKALQELLKERNKELDAVINIVASRDSIIKRLTGRRVCARCGANYHIVYDPPERDGICDQCGGDLITRRDDSEDTVTRRLDVYEKETAPLVAYYEQQGLLRNVNGERSIEEVFREVVALLEEGLV